MKLPLLALAAATLVACDGTPAPTPPSTAPDASAAPDAAPRRDAAAADAAAHPDAEAPPHDAGEPIDAGGRTFDLVDRADTLLVTTATTGASDVIAVDVNGDRALDVVWLGFSRTRDIYGRIDVSLADGSGRLTDIAVVSTTTQPYAQHWAWLVAADIDGDRDLDLLVSRPATTVAQLALFINDGTGRFVEDAAAFPPSDAETLGFCYGRPAFADVDADGDVDVLLPIFMDFAMRRDVPNVLFRAEGDGTFVRVTGIFPQMPVNTDYTTVIAPGDFDGDRDPDLFVGEAQGRARIWRNDGTSFRDVSARNISAEVFYPGTKAVVSDLDADGDLDVAVNTADNRGAPMRVFDNDGSGVFTTQYPPALSQSGTYDLVSGDVDRNGHVDLVWSNQDAARFEATLERAELDESGEWVTRPVLTSTQANLIALGLGDLDGDGDLDLAASSTTARFLFISR